MSLAATDRSAVPPLDSLGPPLVRLQSDGVAIELRHERRRRSLRGRPLWVLAGSPGTPRLNARVDSPLRGWRLSPSHWVLAGQRPHRRAVTVTLTPDLGPDYRSVCCRHGWLVLLPAEAAHQHLHARWYSADGKLVTAGDLPPLRDLVDTADIVYYAPIGASSG